MPTILVVEDDPTMAEMVAYNLRRHGLTVQTEADGRRGMAHALRSDVDLLVLDVMLPEMDGVSLLEQVRRSRPEVPVLLLTALGEEADKLRGFAAGADDYLTKPFSMDELVARVKALIRRAVGDRAPVGEIALGDLRMSASEHRCTVAEEDVALRAKEFALLVALASEPGRAFTRPELARAVWGFNDLGETRTIDTHVKNIRRKVERRSAYTYIDTVRGIGYRFRVRPKAEHAP